MKNYKNKNKKCSKTMDEMISMIQKYIVEHPTPDGVKTNPDDIQYKLGYKRALEDFLFIIA